MTRLFANWSVNDKGVRREKANELQSLYEEIGPARFSKAVARAIREHATGFFPTVGEFMAFVPPREHTQRETCPRCESSSGFVIVRTLRNGKLFDYAQKCDHKQEAANG